ncbi:hypothetical protein, partial [Streptococcus pneumoniae]|uniref:hypothetical protein n=1 Tax=Streptococcus pneumoniae TaxID=1313 RepID=UPI001C7F2A06
PTAPFTPERVQAEIDRRAAVDSAIAHDRAFNTPASQSNSPSYRGSEIQSMRDYDSMRSGANLEGLHDRRDAAQSLHSQPSAPMRSEAAQQERADRLAAAAKSYLDGVNTSPTKSLPDATGLGGVSFRSPVSALPSAT